MNFLTVLIFAKNEVFYIAVLAVIREPPQQPRIRVGVDDADQDPNNDFDSGDENSIQGGEEEGRLGNDDEEEDEPPEPEEEAPVVPGAHVYEWTDIPIHPIPTVETRKGPVPRARESLLPAFAPRPGQCGPQNIDMAVLTVLSVFQLFWTEVVCAQFVDATNEYAHDTHKAEWVKLTVLEFYAFIGIILYMGIVKLPSRAMHWQNGIFNQSYVATVMTRNRFDAIMSCWHWVNTAKFTEAERTTKNRQDGFWSVGGLLTILRGLFKQFYRLSQPCDIDEQTIGFKGRHRAKCYNPNKPQKWHFKVFVLNCALTCYMYDFIMYQGKDEQRPNGLSATLYPIYALMLDVVLRHKNHILYIDNWYTSIDLVELCMKWGIHVTGTVRINKKHLPKAALFPKTGRNQHARGDMRQLSAPLRDCMEKVYFIAWQDNKPVHFLTTFPAYATTVERHNRLANGQHVQNDIPQPTTTAFYNGGMGGTDGFDAFISHYKTTIKTMKWQPRIFTHFLHASVINAQIIFCIMCALCRGDDCYTLLSFTEMLISALCDPWISERDARKAKAARNLTTVTCMNERPVDLHIPDDILVLSGDQLTDFTSPV
jgi:hypothetical protein